jgi:hypothetical protein
MLQSNKWHVSHDLSFILPPNSGREQQNYVPKRSCDISWHANPGNGPPGLGIKGPSWDPDIRSTKGPTIGA